MNLTNLPSKDPKYFRSVCKNCGGEIKWSKKGIAIEPMLASPFVLCLICLDSLENSLKLLGPNLRNGKKGVLK